VSEKAPAIISVFITITLLIILGIFSVFANMILMNGATGNQGVTSTTVSIACQGIGVLLAGITAWKLSNTLITRYNWNRVLAIFATIILATGVGALISFSSIFVGILVSGVR